MDDIAQAIGLAATAASGLSSATSIAQKLKDIMGSKKGPAIEVQALVLDLYNHLIDAKRGQAALEDLLRDLQREQRERDEFATETARYELADTGRGAAVYKLKKDDRSGEPDHCICPACHAKRHKSILQPNPDGGNFMWCSMCGARYASADRDAGSGIRFGRVRRDLGTIDDF